MEVSCRARGFPGFGHHLGAQPRRQLGHGAGKQKKDAAHKLTQLGSLAGKCPLGVFVGKDFHPYGPSPSSASVSPLVWDGKSPSQLFCDLTDADETLMLERGHRWRSALGSFSPRGHGLWRKISPLLSRGILSELVTSPPLGSFSLGNSQPLLFPGRLCRKERLRFKSRAKHSEPQKHPEIQSLPHLCSQRAHRVSAGCS